MKREVPKLRRQTPQASFPKINVQCSLLFPETGLDSATYSETAVSRSLHCLASFLIKLSASVWLYVGRQRHMLSHLSLT